MIKFRALALSAAVILGVAAQSICVAAQPASPASQTDSISLSTVLDKDHFPSGQSPRVIVTMNSLLPERDLYFHGNWYQVHIEGEYGEPPTTLRQRMTTGKLLPGEAPLREDENAETVIRLGGSITHTFLVEYFYDLSAPGKYSAYVDIRDPVSGEWHPTKTLHFVIEAKTP
jgi:hypothetical protein